MIYAIGRLAGCAVVAAAVGGCASLDNLDPPKIRSGKPARMAVLPQPESDGTRIGLRVQVMAEDDAGILAPLSNGKIQFFAFEGDDTTQPDHIWDFSCVDGTPANKLPNSMRSNSFWLPFETPPECKSMTLIAKWSSNDGDQLVHRQQIDLTPSQARFQQEKTAVRPKAVTKGIRETP